MHSRRSCRQLSTHSGGIGFCAAIEGQEPAIRGPPIIAKSRATAKMRKRFFFMFLLHGKIPGLLCLFLEEIKGTGMKTAHRNGEVDDVLREA
jgi:hypothetical protein